MPPANLTTIKVFEQLANLPQPLIRMIRLSGLNSILHVNFFEMAPRLAWDIPISNFAAVVVGFPVVSCSSSTKLDSDIR